MAKKMRLGIFLLAALLQFSVGALAQQTLGGITGTVSDKSGSVLPDTTVTIVGDQTQLTRTQKTNENGAYDFVNLPIGTYTVTVSHEGFQTEKLPTILVQANRTATLNVSLRVGQVGTTIEVQAAPQSTLRLVVFDGAAQQTPIYDRAQLRPGHHFDGPAIVEENSCTTVIPPGYRLEVDTLHNLVVTA